MFVGFQAAGTLGRRLVDGDRRLFIRDRLVEIRARIATLNGFSAHADRTGLLDWARSITPSAPLWMVNHGEELQALSLAKALTDAGLGKAIAVSPGERIEL